MNHSRNDDDSHSYSVAAATTTNASTTTTKTNAPSSSLSFVSVVVLLLPQCFVGFVDAISFMIVTPSLVFYIMQPPFNGTKEQYGIILSTFSLASFLGKPILGYWCDRLGNQFRVPYMCSLVIAACGGLLYFVASAYTGSLALLLVWISRYMGGMGAANATLGFTYIAAVISHHHMTQATSILSMVRILGMSIAPALNIGLSKISGNHHILSIPITPLNSIGLFLFVLNVLSLLVIYLLQHEPQPVRRNLEITTPISNGHNNYSIPTTKQHCDNSDNNKTNQSGSNSSGTWKFWKSLLAMDIIVPILCTLSLNANFQLLETGLAPATNHALHWTPVEISTLFGCNSVWVFVVLAVSYYMSSVGVSDTVLLMFGLLVSTFGYTLLYVLWSMNSSTILFVIPTMITSMSFPFTASPARSLYTKVVHNKVYLRNKQGTMQAIFSMATSVGGFAAPGLVASFVLRTPEQVETSIDQRELTSYALFAPISASIVMIGVLVLYINPSNGIGTQQSFSNDKPFSSKVTANEYTPLLNTTTETSNNDNTRTRGRRSLDSYTVDTESGVTTVTV